jgi:hypothetical protein
MEQMELNFEKIGYVPNTGRIALNILSQVLYPREEVLGIIECVYTATVGVLIVSNRRVFYLGKNLYNKTLLESFAFETIKNIRFLEGRLPFTGSIELTTESRTLKFKACIPSISSTIVDMVKAIIDKSFKVT